MSVEEILSGIFVGPQQPTAEQPDDIDDPKVLVDDARAREVFQATQNLISDGFPRGYFTSWLDSSDTDIIQYKDIHLNVLISGNRVTGEVYEHGLDEPMAAKIIEDSRLDQVIAEHLMVDDDHKDNEFSRDYDYFREGDKLKIYESDRSDSHSDQILFGDMASGQIYEHRLHWETAVKIMHGFRLVAGYVPEGTPLSSSAQLTCESLNQAALDAISLFGDAGVFEGEAFLFEVHQEHARIIWKASGTTVFDQGQLNPAISPTALAKLQTLPGQIHRYRHQVKAISVTQPRQDHEVSL